MDPKKTLAWFVSTESNPKPQKCYPESQNIAFKEVEVTPTPFLERLKALLFTD